DRAGRGVRRAAAWRHDGIAPGAQAAGRRGARKGAPAGPARLTAVARLDRVYVGSPAPSARRSGTRRARKPELRFRGCPGLGAPQRPGRPIMPKPTGFLRFFIGQFETLRLNAHNIGPSFICHHEVEYRGLEPLFMSFLVMLFFVWFAIEVRSQYP